MNYTKRDYEGARTKLAKAGLTERQLNALEDAVLRDAIIRAERSATSAKGMRTHRLINLGSLIAFNDGYQALRVAVYWHHEHGNQRQELREDLKYELPPMPPSTWRPIKEEDV